MALLEPVLNQRKEDSTQESPITSRFYGSAYLIASIALVLGDKLMA